MGIDITVGVDYVSSLFGRAITQDCPLPIMNETLGLKPLTLVIACFFLPARVLAFCHELEVVQGGFMRVAMATAPGVTIEWMGHSTFQITSSKGTRILTDPHGAFDLPHPTLPQHIVTTSHQHGPHNSVHMAPGTPVILHGLTPTGEDWQKISTTIRDVSVYAVPAYHDKSQGMQRGKNAIFVFRVDDICIAHLGDLGHVLTPEQLKMMGKIDLLLMPIAGGYFTVTPAEARDVTKQVNPKIVIPMHFWWEQAVQEFVQGMPKVKMLNTPVLKIAKSELPNSTEVFVMPWGQK
jgi:L-ascorbate metabolism protein UlaG (beta-lactamase superfamily)